MRRFLAPGATSGRGSWAAAELLGGHPRLRGGRVDRRGTRVGARPDDAAARDHRVRRRLDRRHRQRPRAVPRADRARCAGRTVASARRGTQPWRWRGGSSWPTSTRTMCTCRIGSRRSATSRWPIPTWTSSRRTPGSRSTGAGRAASTASTGFPVDDQRAEILSTCFVRLSRRASGAPPRGRRLRRVAGLCGGLGLLDPPGAHGLADRARGRGSVRVPARRGQPHRGPSSVAAEPRRGARQGRRPPRPGGERGRARAYAPRPAPPGGLARRGGGGAARAATGCAAPGPPGRDGPGLRSGNASQGDRRRARPGAGPPCARTAGVERRDESSAAGPGAR